MVATDLNDDGTPDLVVSWTRSQTAADDTFRS